MLWLRAGIFAHPTVAAPAETAKGPEVPGPLSENCGADLFHQARDRGRCVHVGRSAMPRGFPDAGVRSGAQTRSMDSSRIRIGLLVVLSLFAMAMSTTACGHGHVSASSVDEP